MSPVIGDIVSVGMKIKGEQSIYFCPVCKKDKFKKIDFNLVKCEKCGLVRSVNS